MNAQWLELDGYAAVRGKDCTIYLEPRGWSCDRGLYFARLVPDAGSDLARSLGPEDCWPRYYFDSLRAKLEIEAWLMRQEQLIEQTPEEARRAIVEVEARIDEIVSTMLGRPRGEV